MRFIRNCLEMDVWLVAISVMLVFMLACEYARWNTFRYLSDVMR